MVLMMVLTLIPAMPSFAATANRVDRVVSVTSDGKTDVNPPNLIINLDGKGDLKPGQTFRVELSEYAKWIGTPSVTDTYTFAPTTVGPYTPIPGDFTGVNGETAELGGTEIVLDQDYSGGTAQDTHDMIVDIISQISDIPGIEATGNDSVGADGLYDTYSIVNEYDIDLDVTLAAAGNSFNLPVAGTNLFAIGATATGDFDITISRVSDRRLEVTVNAADPDAIIAIPLKVEFDGAPEGAQKVTIVPGNSGVSGESYTFATIGAGAVSMKVDSKTKIARSGNQNVDIIIDEIAIDSFDNNNDYTLKLPKDFSWGTIPANNALAQFTVNPLSDRELLINVVGANDSKLESIFVTATVVPSRDAKYGDVTVNVTRGDISPSSLVIAEYVDYVGLVSVDKVLDVVSGKDEDSLYVAKVKIEEPVEGTLVAGRFIEFSFDKDTASLEDSETLKLNHKSGTNGLVIDASSSKALAATGLVTSSLIETDLDTNLTDDVKKLTDSHQWDLKVNTTSTTASKYELEIPFVVSALHEGDVVLTVKGAGIDEQKVVVAKAVKPVTIEIDKNSSADLKIGVQKQAAPDIIITETAAGTLSEDVTYTLANRYDNAGIIWRNAKIEVIEGDLELDEDTDYVSNGAEIIVETKSTKASKIKISGVEVTLDRTVPYGPFEVNFNFGVTGSQYNNLSSRVERKAYFNVVTPAPGDQNATTTFTMDSTTYTMIINGQPQTMTMDVAPFIQDNRAMLPIKYVADAIGAKVNYDPMSRVATFTKDATVAALYLDSNVLYVNGTPVTMDTKPVISNGRAMVPVIYVAQAFGFQYGTDLVYDAATRSVTIFPVAK